MKSRSSQFPQPFFISVSLVYFLWSACLFFSCYLQLLLRILPHFVLVIYMDGQNLFRCCSSLFRFDLCDFFIVIILQSISVLLNHSKFEVWYSKWRHKNKILDGKRSKLIHHENCVESTWKMFDEKFACDQIFIQLNFSSSNMVFPFFAIFAFC